MRDYFQFFIGQRVVNGSDHKGEVYDISRKTDDRFPVKVRFEDGAIGTFTSEGWYHETDQGTERDIRPSIS